MDNNPHLRRRMRDELADREAQRAQELRSLTEDELTLLEEWIRDARGHSRALTMLACYEKAVIG